MSDQHKEWEDDGRTVADMSGLDRSPLFGHKEGASRKKRQEPSDGDYVPPLSRGDRWAFLLGTMKASLLIALAFLGGLRIPAGDAGGHLGGAGPLRRRPPGAAGGQHDALL